MVMASRAYRAACGIAAAAALCGCANGGWSRADTHRQTAVAAVLAADWLQTREISRNPDRFYETNPVLGRHPSLSAVNAYFAAGLLAHTAVAMALPPPWRGPWQYLTFAFEAGVVAHNASLGIGFGF